MNENFRKNLKIEDRNFKFYLFVFCGLLCDEIYLKMIEDEV